MSAFTPLVFLALAFNFFLFVLTFEVSPLGVSPTCGTTLHGSLSWPSWLVFLSGLHYFPFAMNCPSRVCFPKENFKNKKIKIKIDDPFV